MIILKPKKGPDTERVAWICLALGVSSEVTLKNGSNKKDAFVPYFRP